jgi:signal transduction histidine kinase
VSDLDLSGAASGRLERSFSKIYAGVLLATSSELIANAIFQSQYLNSWSWFLVGLVLVPIVAMNIWAWTKDELVWWPYLHGASVLIAMLMWPWVVVDGDALPAEYQPWIWWGVGMAVISVGVTAPRWLGVGFLVLVPVAWFLLDTSYFGGTSDPLVSIQDSVYVFLLGGSVSGLILMSRQAAKRADQANSLALASAIEQAQIDAVERERQRIDALVHDRVLNTLVLAANAQTKEEFVAVTHMASEAIESLEQAAQEPPERSQVTLLGLYRALRKAAVRLIPNIEVITETGGLIELPSDVAQAITEATIQALDNAARHSKANRVTLRLSSTPDHDLEIEIADDGIGFRVDRIARDRIGIRTSITARLQLVRAQASIISQPGAGTRILIRWSR